MASVGYQHLQESLGLSAFPPRLPAFVKLVTRIEPTPTFLAVPGHAAPRSDTALDHILFALKHEGVDLQILSEALGRVSADDLRAELVRTPNGKYLRIAACLWELLGDRTLDDAPLVGGASVDLFDAKRYVTGRSRRIAKWRVDFNGLGTPRYCATVERTKSIQAAIASDLPGRVADFVATLGGGILDRTLAWAYLHETRDSFAIECEVPSEDKAEAFIKLLRQAHDRTVLTEEYLAELQSTVVANRANRAGAFRMEQNWLEGPLRGAAAVTYVPPPPALARELMDELMTFLNEGVEGVDPIVAASIASFGFVYIHPFMDGNGRLSRFLFHHTLCRQDALPDGLVLPVSVAMKKNERDYLRALETYSRDIRRRWAVQWIDAGEYQLEFTGADSLYRYWNATECVEFCFRMAEQALEVELRDETAFLVRYDRIAAAVNARFDVRGSDLSTLLVSCLDNAGKLSARRRDQFGERVPAAVFELIEQLAAADESTTTDERRA